MTWDTFSGEVRSTSTSPTSELELNGEMDIADIGRGGRKRGLANQGEEPTRQTVVDGYGSPTNRASRDQFRVRFARGTAGIARSTCRARSAPPKNPKTSVRNVGRAAARAFASSRTRCGRVSDTREEMNGGVCASESFSAIRAGFDARVVPRARSAENAPRWRGATRRSRRTVSSSPAAGIVVAPRRRAGPGWARALPRDDGIVTAEPEERADERAEAAEDATDGGGWWAWTKRWALGESSEEEDAVESPAARSVDDAASATTASAGEPEGEVAFFERVPLPPWLRVQVDRVLAPRDDERSGEDARPRSSPERPARLRRPPRARERR